jgi:hypothetical protein
MFPARLHEPAQGPSSEMWLCPGSQSTAGPSDTLAPHQLSPSPYLSGSVSSLAVVFEEPCLAPGGDSGDKRNRAIWSH